MGLNALKSLILATIFAEIPWYDRHFLLANEQVHLSEGKRLQGICKIHSHNIHTFSKERRV